MSQERRQFQRIEFDNPVLLRQGDTQLTAKVIDISLKGVLIDQQTLPFDNSQPVDLSIPLSDTVSIDMKARWSHSRNGASGFQWTLVDLDSLTHLRRLLEFNSENPLLLERELAHLSSADQPGG
ncbi:MAG TPA: PilZ domain-containing protein [Pseudomonadales bacterium]